MQGKNKCHHQGLNIKPNDSQPVPLNRDSSFGGKAEFVEGLRRQVESGRVTSNAAVNHDGSNGISAAHTLDFLSTKRVVVRVSSV